jgi:NADH:ubiquinone oxidoreductase subunit 2 (subunit N)
MMWNQPAFWIMALPLLAAAILWPLGRWPRAQAVTGAALALLLALWLRSLDLPAEGAIWSVVGRSFILTPGLQPFFVFLLLSLGLLSLLAWPIPAGPRFVPVALGLLAPAAGMLMIRPFIFAAPFWFVLVIAGLLLFRYEDDAGMAAVQAALRYWLLMLVALLLLLLATWMLGSTQAVLLFGARLLLLALAIMLAGFPFFIWVRPLVTAVPLLALPVLLVLLPLLALVLAVQLMAAYPLIGQTDAFLVWLPWSAGLTVFLAGFLTLSGGGWRLLLASLVLLDMGFALLSLGLVPFGGWETAVSQHGLRLVSLLLVVAGLALMSEGNRYSLSGNRYQGWLLLYGLLSLLGLPLTPGFSGRWLLLVDLGRSELASLPLALLLVGGMGLAAWGIVRQIRRLADGANGADGAEETADNSDRRQRVAALVVLLLAFVLATFPQLLLTPLRLAAPIF